MFKVKATVVGFLGDEAKYPCHHQYKIGDKFIYDGENFIGRICPSLAPLLVSKLIELHAAGPRYVDPIHYFPFWYSPVSVEDPNLKKYDGLGFRNVLTTYVEPQGNMANLVPANAFKWPPHPERTVAKDITIICPDFRTSVLVKLEAFDLADKGRNVPYFRRQMAILDKVLTKPGIQVDKILNEFSKEEIEGIYPALSQVMVQALVEELELMGYLEIRNGKASATKKGEVKLQDFKASLSAEEREALGVWST
jgi:uncharacterized repeat protein (TIGR04076 family)